MWRCAVHLSQLTLRHGYGGITVLMGIRVSATRSTSYIILVLLLGDALRFQPRLA